MPGGASKGKVKKHFKAKHQKKRVFRSSDPVLSVFMWGINHTVSVCNIMCIGHCIHTESIVCSSIYKLGLPLQTHPHHIFAI